MAEPAFTACEAAVRKADFDRYLAALFAPAAVRPHLFALYAFNYEVAKTAETVSQPTLGLIRLQWWKDAIGELYLGARIREHATLRALAETVHAHDLPRVFFEALIEARENDLEETPFADMAQLEAYADATSSHVMRLALRVLADGVGLDPGLDAIAREAGIAYALTGLLRALPHHAAQRRLMLPLSTVNAAGLSPDDIFSGKMSVRLSALIATIAEAAHTHFDEAHARAIARRFLPALLPAVLTQVYLKRLTRRGFDPFRDATDVPVHRRQLAMLSAMLRARL